jgi:hypothetical protein
MMIQKLGEVGNCDICAEQKILFMNEMKRYKIYWDRKVEFKKPFELYRQILLTVLLKVALNFIHFGRYSKDKMRISKPMQLLHALTWLPCSMNQLKL